jgi:hypothetical protein
VVQGTSQPAAEAPKAENPFINIAFNVIIPAVILTKMSGEDRLGPVGALLVALAFPVLYGAWDFATRRKHNFISILGFVSILLTGGLGLMKLDGFWFAVKEAAVPAVIAVAVIVSQWTRWPLVKVLLFNDAVMDTGKVEQSLRVKQAEGDFAALIRSTSLIVASSFVLSAVLNFVLARHLLTAPPGSEEFNTQLGKMTALSWPVIAVPSMTLTAVALWRLFAGIKRLTGLDLEQILKTR